MRLLLLLIFLCGDLSVCKATIKDLTKTDVIFDTDANNELDDQHALAYLLFNSDVFNVKGITVNATRNGGDIHLQLTEAKRVMQLCNSYEKIPLLPGANKDFVSISDSVKQPDFDGASAVKFIISQSLAKRSNKLVILAVGKLTNVALALKIMPSIVSKIKVVWLGSNYPDPGEYNLEDDIPALNYVLSTEVQFEMVVVRYGAESGSGAVRAKKADIEQIMPGKGPKIEVPVEGRNGHTFLCFGDYSVDLFNHIPEYLQDSSRALFDMTAVAILKNPHWGKSSAIPAPYYSKENDGWVQWLDNQRKIIYWDQFNKDAIMTDFYNSMSHYHLPE